MKKNLKLDRIKEEYDLLVGGRNHADLTLIGRKRIDQLIKAADAQGENIRGRTRGW